MTLRDYLPILIYFAGGLAVGGAILALSVMGPRRPNRVKALPYESGILPTTPARQRFSIDFYLTAMLFIVFDIEIIFLYPWAVTFDRLGLFGLVEMVTFVVTVLVAYVYVWRRGGLEWD